MLVPDSPVEALAIFDLDGTLVDSAQGVVGCVAETLRSHGYPEDVARIRGLVGLPLIEIFTGLGVPEDEASGCVDEYRARYVEYGLAMSNPFPGVRQMLDRLRARDIHMAVATSKLESVADQMLDHHGLKDEFVVVVGATRDGSRLHKDELIREVLVRLKPRTPRAVMVGDRDVDMIGARSCNVTAIGAGWGYSVDHELAGARPHDIADSPLHAVDLISGVLAN